MVIEYIVTAFGQDRRASVETCALLLAAAGQWASHAAAVGSDGVTGRGAAASERVTNQERQRIERSEVNRSGQVSPARQVGGEKQAKQGIETAKRAAILPEGVNADIINNSLDKRKRQAYGFRVQLKLKSEIPADTSLVERAEWLSPDHRTVRLAASLAEATGYPTSPQKAAEGLPGRWSRWSAEGTYQ